MSIHSSAIEWKKKKISKKKSPDQVSRDNFSPLTLIFGVFSEENKKELKLF